MRWERNGGANYVSGICPTALRLFSRYPPPALHGGRALHTVRGIFIRVSGGEWKKPPHRGKDSQCIMEYFFNIRTYTHIPQEDSGEETSPCCAQSVPDIPFSSSRTVSYARNPSQCHIFSLAARREVKCCLDAFYQLVYLMDVPRWFRKRHSLGRLRKDERSAGSPTRAHLDCESHS